MVGIVGAHGAGGVENRCSNRISGGISWVIRCAKRDASDPSARPGEAAVEIAPVGHVALLLLEAEDVDDRHAHERAARDGGGLVEDQFADDPGAV